MSSVADVEEIKTDLVMRALAGAVDQRPDWRDPAMEALYAYQDLHLMYGACCGWATAVHAVAKTSAPDGGFVGLVSLNVDTGKVGSLDDVPIPREVKAAIRFILAVGNDDSDISMAIFFGAVESSPGDADALIAAVLFMSGQILRGYVERKRDGGAS